MFLDEVVLDVGSGNGGRGAVSFRREKYVPNGGPDGGDGGRGGNVTLRADAQLSTLGDFRQRHRYTAHDGTAGGKTNKHGKDADDLILTVPAGTVVRDGETNEFIVDLLEHDQSIVVVPGGRGGRGNARFASATHQSPRLVELGEPGTRRTLHLELKLIADIGLVGLPNAGKSTLLGALTGAHPKIAAYPFTTLTPNLGVAETEDSRALVIADVPGLIEGAHLGVGLGIDFLRHLERTRVLVHLVDASGGEEAALLAISQVRAELEAFSDALATKPQVVAFNKIDIVGARDVAEGLRTTMPGVHAIAAATGEGCRELFDAVVPLVVANRAATIPTPRRPGDADQPVHRVYKHQPASAPVVVPDDDGWRVFGAHLERMVAMTDLDNEEALARLQRRLRSAGVDTALGEAGAEEGDTVRIGRAEFDYSPETY